VIQFVEVRKRVWKQTQDREELVVKHWAISLLNQAKFSDRVSCTFFRQWCDSSDLERVCHLCCYHSWLDNKCGNVTFMLLICHIKHLCEHQVVLLGSAVLTHVRSRMFTCCRSKLDQPKFLINGVANLIVEGITCVLRQKSNRVEVKFELSLNLLRIMFKELPEDQFAGIVYYNA